MALASLVRFVVARPSLFALGMRIVNRVPPLKWFLWRIHATTRNNAPLAQLGRAPGTTPLSARPAYLQLTAERREH